MQVKMQGWEGPRGLFRARKKELNIMGGFETNYDGAGTQCWVWHSWRIWTLREVEGCVYSICCFVCSSCFIQSTPKVHHCLIQLLQNRFSSYGNYDECKQRVTNEARIGNLRKWRNKTLFDGEFSLGNAFRFRGEYVWCFLDSHRTFKIYLCGNRWSSLQTLWFAEHSFWMQVG